MRRTRRLALLAALGLVGCGVTADDCNPERNQGLLTAAACTFGGGYQERNHRLAADIEAQLASHRLAQEEVQRLEAEAARLAGDQAAWEQRLATMEGEATGIEQELARLRAVQAKDRVALGTLRDEAGGLRQELEAARDHSPAVEAEIRALTIEVERRREAIRQILEGMGAE